MSPEQIAAIERLRELDRRVGYWQWGQDEQFSHHVLYDDGFCFSVCETDSADALPTHAEFIVTLRNEALPLIEALQQALSEAQADARVFSGSYNALAEDFGRLKEENERLRAGIAKALKHLQRNMFDDVSYARIELEALHDA